MSAFVAFHFPAKNL